MEKPWFLDLSDREVWLHGQWNEWDWAAHDHEAFKVAFETLVAEGCDGRVLLDILERIHDLAVNDPGERASPDDFRQLRAALDQGRQALAKLRHEIPLEEVF